MSIYALVLTVVLN
jgi:hypothetical protein